MKTPPTPLAHRHFPWLFAVALCTTLPHALHQPAWLTALAGIALSGTAWLWWTRQTPLGTWLKVLLVLAGCVGIALEYGTLLGRDAGVAMLVLFMALKFLEMRQLRDAMVVVMLGYFLLLTHYFYSQSIPTGLWLLGSAWIITASLAGLHGPAAGTPRQHLTLALGLLAQALPLMALLFILFPRVSGPLWGLPQDAHAGRTGLADSMSPGSFAQLAQSPEIAFRARFEGTPPERGRLYWRGPVLENYDGRSWQQGNPAETPPRIESSSPQFTYALTLEAHNQRWLLALDMPTQLPRDSQLNSVGTALQKRNLTSRQRYTFTSAPAYILNRDEQPQVLANNLQLPAGRNPRAIALAQSWRATIASPEQIVQTALRLFREENFVYTLRPPLLGEQAMDEFLFVTRRGFCEHYASAFVVLMRAAGIPARVVAGYQGGELNPLDDYLVVRQSDAHAWAEVWLQGQGWVRVDPTAAISPARIESGISAALPVGEPLPALLTTRLDWLRGLRNRWEAINNGWNQWVLGYNPLRQQELLARLGLQDPDWKSMAVSLGLGMGAMLLVLAAWTFRPARTRDPAKAIWIKALRRLRRKGIACPDWETPLALAHRLEQEAPALAGPVKALAERVTAARYQPGSVPVRSLRAALRQIP